jgi:hypothetical protein
MKKIACGLLAFLLVAPGADTADARGFLVRKIKNRNCTVSPLYLPSPVITSFNKACEIEDFPDYRDYWQAPQETNARKKGDCEDKAFYLYSLLAQESHSSRVVAGSMYGDFNCGHMWVEYETSCGTIILDPAVKKIYKKSSVIRQHPRQDYVEYEESLGYVRDIREFIESFSKH